MKNYDNLEFAYDATEMFTADDTFLYAREPVLRRMPDGSLLSLIYTGGTREPHPDNVAAVIRSFDNGNSWTKPEILFKHPFLCTWPTELFTEGKYPFAIFQTFDFRTNYCSLRAHISTTKDSGKTWSPPATIHGVPPNFTVRQGKVLSDGSWIFPIYWEEAHNHWDFQTNLEKNIFHAPGWIFVSGVLRTDDQGKTFQIHGSVTSGGGLHAWEPEITELEPGHLKMYYRCECPEHVLWESDSFDFGRTWSSSKRSSIPNPGTKVVLYDIKGSKVLINNVCSMENPNRCTLELWVSNDLCKTWHKKIRLATLHRNEKNPWEGFFTERSPIPQVAYPHGFADDNEEVLVLALDCVRKFFLMKIPFADILSK